MGGPSVPADALAPSVVSAIASTTAVMSFRKNKQTGSRLNIQMLSYQYKDSHHIDKMVSWPSYLHNGNPYTWKVCLYIETGPWSHYNLVQYNKKERTNNTAVVTFELAKDTPWHALVRESVLMLYGSTEIIPLFLNTSPGPVLVMYATTMV